MNVMRVCTVCAVPLLVACGGSSGGTNSPAPTISASLAPLTMGSENIAASNSPTTVPLPNIGGVYGGQLLLPSGSGTATLTFAINPPPGIAALTELTPQPTIAYITITALSPFTLATSPGFNLSVPSSYAVIDMWLNYYANSGWSNVPPQLGSLGVNMQCFKPQGSAVSLLQGQSLYLGINGDSVLPTPPVSGVPLACPQP